MAELTPEEQQKYNNLLEQYRSILERLKNTTGMTAAEMAQWNGVLANTKQQISELETRMGSAQLMMSRMKDTYESLKTAWGNNTEVSGLVKTIGQNLTGAMNQYGQALLAFSSSHYTNFINPIGKSNEVAGTLGKGITQVDSAISNLLQTQNVARTAFTLLGDSSKGAEDAIVAYPTALRGAAVATGITTDELNKMNQTMQIVPGALKQVQGGIMGIAEIQGMAIQPTAVLATTLKAFGMNAAESAKLGVDAWKNYGQTTEETIQQMGRMADAARQTGVDRRTANDQIMQASQSLAIFGGKTSSAAETWTTFMSGLRDSGVPIKSVGDIVNQVTNAISGMSVQHRAFIGMVSGMTQGSTALGGALQLEVAMRSPEGMQKNLEALTGTLSQFAGGKIITIEEAAKNPQLEMQFQLQRQMLGKLTGITTQEQQNRILETLHNVQRGGMSTVEGTQTLQDVYKEGKTIQEKSLTALTRIEQFLRFRFGEAADRQLGDIDQAFRTMSARQGPGIEERMRAAGGVRADVRRPITEAIPVQSATVELGNQIRNFHRTVEAQAGRRPSKDAASADFGGFLRRMRGGLTGEYEGTPELRRRQVRLPQREATPAIVPMVFDPELVRQRTATVPTMRTAATTREPARTTDARRDLSAVTNLIARSDENKMQIMSELLANVKLMTGRPAMTVPETLLTPTATAKSGTTSAVGTPIEATAGTTSTLVIKIQDESGSEKSEKIKHDVLEKVKNYFIGINQ